MDVAHDRTRNASVGKHFVLVEARERVVGAAADTVLAGFWNEMLVEGDCPVRVLYVALEITFDILETLVVSNGNGTHDTLSCALDGIVADVAARTRASSAGVRACSTR